MVKRTGGALLLSLSVDPASPRPVSSQLCAALRDIILGGGVGAGERLPASRTLARELGVSRTTIVEVFGRLTAEGLVESRTGAGTFVSDALRANRPISPPPGSRRETRPRNTRKPRVSRAMARAATQFVDRLPHQGRAFTTALPAFDAFPLAQWSRMVARHWRAPRDSVMGYAEPQGLPALRQSVAAHLRANRGIACEADQVFIVGGAQQAFRLLGSALLDPNDVVWFENPGAIGARNSLVASGAQLLPVPVDEAGLVVREGLRRAARFRLVLVTPSHQQPLGVTMSLERRFELLRAAEAADALVIEDDYDGEFCYGPHPPPTLKSVDGTGRVIYVGTFSKTLFPALRLGYFVAPPALVDIFHRIIGAFSQGVPSHPQAVVAEFMAEGHFATHIRRMRRIYAERQQVLLDASRRHLDGLLEVAPANAGLHTIGHLPREVSATEVAERAARAGITVAPIERFCIEPVAVNGLVLGFSGIAPAGIVAGVRGLARVLAQGRGSASARSTRRGVRA